MQKKFTGWRNCINSWKFAKYRLHTPNTVRLLCVTTSAMASETKLVDGSVLEGGGQILRNAAALSCLLQQPITISKIRAGRNNPGLRAQHLQGLELLRNISGGQLHGATVGSTDVTLEPGQLKANSYLADTKTAGSTSLLLQASLPCLLYTNGPSELTLKGGTNADMAPPVDYLIWVFKPIAQKFGIHFDCEIVRRGFYPKGGGVVRVQSQPCQSLQPVQMTDPGEITSITGLAYVAGVLPKKMAHSMAQVASNILSRHYNMPVHIDAVKDSEQHAFGNGSGIIVMAETSTGCKFGGTALGKRGVTPEQVGQTAAEMLLRNVDYGGCCDEYLQDQLIILMALAKGKSSVLCGPITLHTQTAIHVAELLTKAKFEIKEMAKDKNVIECEGIGLGNASL